MDVHTICLIGGTILYCVLAFYLLQNIFFFSSSRYLSRLCGLFPLRHPSRSGCGGVLPWIHNNWYLAYILFPNNCYKSMINMKVSVIKFDIQMFDGVINFSWWQIRMNAIFIQSGLKKKYCSRGRKSLKTWKKKLGKSWMRKPWRLFSFAWRTIYEENSVLAVGATSGPLFEEDIGESVDSEATSFSFSHAWRYTY